jgi:hypothetical protein
MTSGFDQLERELRDAEQRLAAQRRSVHPRVRRLFPSGAAIAVVCGSLVAVVIALAALTLSGRPARPIGASALPRGRTLTAELAVLRQPQTAAARAFNHSALLDHIAKVFRQRPNASQTRAARLPGGAELFFYVLPPAQHRHARNQLWAVVQPGGVLQSQTAQTIRKPHDPTPAGGLSPGKSTHYYEIVPDGVARVRWEFPRQAIGGPGPGPVYPKPLEVTVAVHDNVAAFTIPPPERGYASVDTWYAADGSVIASRGSTASLEHVVASPKPGAQTAQSRRAERDPRPPTA